MREGVISGVSPRMIFSISSSTSSGSLKPSALKILIPLSSEGLWEAVIMIPQSAPMERTRWATAGVGSGPISRTSMPMLSMPLVSAVSSMYPETRVSLPITAFAMPFLFAWICATAFPTLSAISGVIGYSFALPRIPSVPNNLGITLYPFCLITLIRLCLLFLSGKIPYER